MNIGAINSSLSFSIIRHYSEASRAASGNLQKIAANSRVVTAADNPSAIGTIERLKSQISENKILAQSANPGAIALKALSGQTEALKGRFDVSLAAGDESSLRDLVTALRSSASFSDAEGIKVFAGDASNPEKTVINHPATAAVVSGSATGGNVTFTADSSELEGGVNVDKATLNFEVDGNAFSVKVNAGSYTNAEALSMVSSALSGSGVTVSHDANAFSFTNTASSGAASTLTLSGNVASGMNATGSASGSDAFDEEVIGAAGSLKVSYGGREVIVMNLNAEADKLEKLLDDGDVAGAQTAGEGLSQRLGGLDSNAKFAASMLEGDSLTRLSRVGVLQDQLDNITKLDLTEETIALTKNKIRMEQAAWAMQALSSTESDNIKTLLGLK